MTIHITWEGLFACIGVGVTAVVVIAVAIFLFGLARWGR